MNRNDGLIIIPALNEEANIGQVLQEIRDQGLNLDIVIIDDGSVDDTARIAEELGEKVIKHLYNIGYGGALQTGFKYALEKEYNYVIQFDADGQHDPSDIQKLVLKLQEGGGDIVIGSRFLGSGFKIGFFKMNVIRFFRLVIRSFTGSMITDPTSGLQALNRRAFANYAAMGNFPEDFPDADTLIRMLRSKFRVVEVPVNIKERTSGVSMHKGLKAVYYLLKMSVSISVVLVRTSFIKG